MKENTYDYDAMFEEDCNSPEIECVLELIRALPKEYGYVLNLPRYKEILETINILKGLIADTLADAEYEMSFDDICLYDLFLSVKLEYLDLDSDGMEKLRVVLNKVDSITIEALPDGRAGMTMIFRNARILF